MSIKKSVLTATVAVAALGLSATSFAAPAVLGSEGAGFVIGVQGGYADEHWSNALDSSDTGVNSTSVKDTGFAARGFVGYDFNRFLGLEAGYTYLPKATVNNPLFGGFDIKNYAVDLLAKLSVPVATCFSLYAKAGASYLHSKADASGVSAEVSGISAGTSSHIGPAFGVGAAYEVVPNLAIDLSWMRFSGQGNFSGENNTNYQPSPDVVLLGVSYKFPTHYS